MSLVMDDGSSAAPFFFSSFSHPLESSTGYLEDALVEFGSKRRRLMMYGDDHQVYVDGCSESSWNSNFSCLSQISTSREGRNSEEEETTVTLTEVKSTPISTSDHQQGNKIRGSDGDGDKNGSVMKRVAYPFALVKPGGVEGEVTLSDINRRMLMPPTRPLRHPVGDFACRPQGISGKVVVALTRIQTPGRGTITIVRTKG